MGTVGTVGTFLVDCFGKVFSKAVLTPIPSLFADASIIPRYGRSEDVCAVPKDIDACATAKPLRNSTHFFSGDKQNTWN